MKFSFLKPLTALLMIVFGYGPILAVADIDIRNDTSARGFERREDSGDVEPGLPVHGCLSIEYGDAEQGGLSLHLYGGGRKDSAGSDLHMADQDSQRLYGHLGPQKPGNQFSESIGRRHLFAGVANRSAEGLRLNAGIAPNLSANIIKGLSSFNIDSVDWKEHRYDARFLVSHLMIESYFQYFSYQDYFYKENSRNNIFHFLQNEEEILAISGTDIVWQGLGAVDVGVRGRHYDYDINQESASYMAGLLTVNTSSDSQVGVEIGRMDGETADNVYYLYRGYFYWKPPLRIKTQGFISGDALYIAYDAPVYGEDKSIQYSLSAGRRFFNNRMETKLSGIFSQDPYFDSDVGGAVTLQIHY